MHEAATRAEAMRLIRSGLNDCEVSRRLAVPRSTIRDRRRPTYVPKCAAITCPRCWRGTFRPFAFTDADYSELLGLYLGDGHIVRTGRADRLPLFLDARCPRIVAEARELLERCFPGRTVGSISAHGGRMIVLSLYCTHLACLFRQHGPGKKHERPIVLEGWQQDLVARESWAFLRGCIRSDGYVFVNRTGRYEYLSYDFKNRSADILDLFTDACELVGVAYRRYTGNVRIYRRGSVALMLEHVGVKE